MYIIYLYILLGTPGIFPISQDEGWRMGISQPAKGYGLTMQTFATDLFSLSIETIYLMFWKDVFLLHFSPDRHKQMVVLRCWHHVWGPRNGTFGCSLLVSPAGIACTTWGMLVLCPDVSDCPSVKAKDKWPWCRRWCDPFKTPNGIFSLWNFPMTQGLKWMCVKHDLL